MRKNVCDIIKDEKEVRVWLDDNFLLKLREKLNNTILELSKELKLHPKSLEGKLKKVKGHSFKLTEILLITSKINIPEDELRKYIQKIKINNNSKWITPFDIEFDEHFVEGVGYYVGDGRIKSSRSISTVNNEASVINFFLKWVMKYFKAKLKDLKIKIFMPHKKYKDEEVRNTWSEELKIPTYAITKITTRKGKRILNPFVEVSFNNSTVKTIFDNIIPIAKDICIKDIELAKAFLRGILAAEGSVKYNKNSSSRQIQIKMKSKDWSKFNKILLEKIGCRPSLRPTKDNEWVVILTGYEDLERINLINGFELHQKKSKKLGSILTTYKHKQVKQGYVKKVYLQIISDLQTNRTTEVTTKEILKTIKRDRTRISSILKFLYKHGFLDRKQLNKRGGPYSYTLTLKGLKFISSLNHQT
jgi:predicted transcriptional regulator